MQRDLQIIGDRIEFMGYWVGDVKDVPASIKGRFVDWLAKESEPYPSYAQRDKYAETMKGKQT